MKRDVEFLYEMGAMRYIPRQWQRFHMPNIQSLTEHHFRVAWLALIIAAREGKGDTGKIVKMAIAHDIAESRTGDVDYMSRQYVTNNEDMAIHDMLEDTSIEKEFLELYEEYEKRESIESKIVKDADNLDVDFDLMEQSAMGVNLREQWGSMREAVSEKKLYTETAKKIFQEIQESNPHSWHVNSSRNRLNSGDWKDI